MRYSVFIKKHGIYWLITLLISLVLFIAVILIENELVYSNVIVEKAIEVREIITSFRNETCDSSIPIKPGKTMSINILERSF